MSLFKKIFSKKPRTAAIPKGFFNLEVIEINRLTDDAVEIKLAIPTELEDKFKFAPGQYLNFSIDINGKEERRSYSICSAPDLFTISVAIKKVDKGVVSNWMNTELVVGDSLFVAPPAGNFTLKDENNIVAIAAGSGITPILSMAKSIEGQEKSMQLFFGNKTSSGTMFKKDIDALANTNTIHFYTQEDASESTRSGRITKDSFTSELKANLLLLKADGFFICGPEEMIMAVNEVLTTFGVAKEKIHFELFTTPVLQPKKDTPQSDFTGTSKVKVILDDETFDFTLKNSGRSILEEADKQGIDVPYSCKGGVCCTCRAKLIKGKAVMDLNYSLTDKEIEDGYILTCQAHPASEELIVSYDD